MIYNSSDLIYKGAPVTPGMTLSDETVVSALCKRFRQGEQDIAAVLFIHRMARGKTIDEQLWWSEEVQDAVKKELSLTLGQLMEQCPPGQKTGPADGGVSKLVQNPVYRGSNFAFYNNRVREEVGRATQQYVAEFLMAEKSE